MQTYIVAAIGAISVVSLFGIFATVLWLVFELQKLINADKKYKEEQSKAFTALSKSLENLYDEWKTTNPKGTTPKEITPKKKKQRPYTRFTKDQVLYIRSQEGIKTADELAKEFNKEPGSIRAVWRRRVHANV